MKNTAYLVAIGALVIAVGILGYKLAIFRHSPLKNKKLENWTSSATT